MLIEKYDLEIFTPPCDPGAERYSARARLIVDISETLPYLNATLRGAIYHPSASALTWKKAGTMSPFTLTRLRSAMWRIGRGQSKSSKR